VAKLTPDVMRERQRAFRLEETTKKAVRVANHYKVECDRLSEENQSLKKELANTSKQNDRINKVLKGTTRERTDIAMFFAKLDSATHFKLRNIVRKALHPDKHVGLTKGVKDVLGQLFAIIEEKMK